MDQSIIELADRVRAAAAARTPLCIRAGGTKDFYGNPVVGRTLDPRCLDGIVSYEPSELVITARAGTSLSLIETTLAERGQMLAFEPPHFGDVATIGGCVAAGLAGPRRASAGPAYGSVRDFVLGARLLDGRGQLLSFGGTVMKNVAGYDVARALAGSLGVLGIITEVSIKVLPRPVLECTLQFELNEHDAIHLFNEWASKGVPISASAWHAGTAFVRLGGAASAVRTARELLGGSLVDAKSAEAIWEGIREHTHPFFAHEEPLWRLSVPSTTPALPHSEQQLIEWGGALRWIRSRLPGEQMRALATKAGGHATLFRAQDRSRGAFTPLSPTLLAIHQRLKSVFDPSGIFNPGRMYPEF